MAEEDRENDTFAVLVDVLKSKLDSDTHRHNPLLDPHCVENVLLPTLHPGHQTHPSLFCASRSDREDDKAFRSTSDRQAYVPRTLPYMPVNDERFSRRMRLHRISFLLQVPYNQAELKSDRPYFSVTHDHENMLQFFFRCRKEHSHAALVCGIDVTHCVVENLSNTLPSIGVMLRSSAFQFRGDAPYANKGRTQQWFHASIFDSRSDPNTKWHALIIDKNNLNSDKRERMYTIPLWIRFSSVLKYQEAIKGLPGHASADNEAMFLSNVEPSFFAAFVHREWSRQQRAEEDLAVEDEETMEEADANAGPDMYNPRSKQPLVEPTKGAHGTHWVFSNEQYNTFRRQWFAQLRNERPLLYTAGMSGLEMRFYPMIEHIDAWNSRVQTLRKEQSNLTFKIRVTLDISYVII